VRKPMPAATTRCLVNEKQKQILRPPKARPLNDKKRGREARQEHYFVTLPWADNGYRVLPA